MPEKVPSRVFQAVSADYFSWAGHTFLVYADRLSGWPFVYRVKGEASARDLTRNLRRVFSMTGAPQTLRTDGGGQFSAKHTRDFLRRWGVEHQQSTPHYPQSNGHSEAAVKSVKRLVKKASQNGDIDIDAFAFGLLELRNTPHADGRSPAQILYGHPLRSAVPAHHRAFAARWQRAADECDEKVAQLQQQTEDRYNVSARTHRPLRVGQRVLIQDPNSKLWDRTGTITAVGARRDYMVKLPSGRLFWRNRRYLRPQRAFVWETTAHALPSAEAASADPRMASQHVPVPQMSPPASPAPAAAASASPVALAAPPAVRRSNRNRQEAKKMTVHWGTKTYF